jgi:hypothetical protein
MHKPHFESVRSQQRVLEKGRRRCPVCKAGVYSASGVHPQCAMTVTPSTLLLAPVEPIVSE